MRNKILIKREPAAFMGKIFQGIFIALIILALYWKVGGYTQQDIQSLTGFFFFFAVGAFFGNYFGVIIGFQNERPVFLR